MSDDASIGLDVQPTEALPLDAWHRARGGRMVEFAGYWLPIQYDGIIAEHLWTRESAGLFDVSHMGQLQVSGPNAAAELEKILPGDVIGLKAGKVRYSLLLDENGGILDDLMVTNAGDHLFLIVNGACKWDDIAHLREFLPDEIHLHYQDEHALLALQGPKAVDALARLGLVPAAEGAPAVEGLRFMEAAPYLWGERPLGISRSGYTGEDGFEISVHADDAEALADALTAQPEVKPIGLGARDSLRLEAGLPLYGHDLHPGVSVIAAGLGFAVSKRRRTEGGFLGDARVMAELLGAPAQVRVGLTLDGRLPAREGAAIHAGETQVGTVTSGGFAPSIGAPIAMGWVDAAHAATGTPLTIEVRGKHLTAKVAAMPFVPHRYVRRGATT
ncbi:glycine cleavage system aminomethyltransferase GcvT [Sphingobium sufflavum]|uniref:glycine cleavage system aminomethyltransferase GcvT n=1 Tax=Sphingobium sufflavum TaxID=1129547 RepID=UPI001F248684|nr:glycine cleavage system aminomethyltransferase GcvT [Sphingobium sufflavum]MCE7795886.1 glycine cleavage system aminomethyltransferase GcvT [Sphingobium sufflavum]